MLGLRPHTYILKKNSLYRKETIPYEKAASLVLHDLTIVSSRRLEIRAAFFLI